MRKIWQILVPIQSHSMRVGLSVALSVALLGPSLAWAQKRPPPQVTVEAAVMTKFVDRIEALGTLRANELVSITATVTERISRLGFDDGERVEAGHVLAELDKAREMAQLAEARAEVAEAKTKLERGRDLRRRGVASAAELTSLQRSYAVAQARRDVVQADLNYRIIKAPFAGRIGIRNVSVGTTVKPGDEIVRLVDDSVMKLDFSIPGILLSKMAPGVAIEAQTRAFAGEVFRGTVFAIDSTIDPISRAVLVRAKIPNDGLRLVPGLLMEVDLLVNPRQALTVSEQSITLKGAESFVYVVSNSDKGDRGLIATLRPVSLGTRRVGEVEVLSGLSAGEQVVTTGAMRLRSGQRVRLRAISKSGKDSSAEVESPLKKSRQQTLSTTQG